MGGSLKELLIGYPHESSPSETPIGARLTDFFQSAITFPEIESQFDLIRGTGSRVKAPIVGPLNL